MTPAEIETLMGIGTAIFGDVLILVVTLVLYGSFVLMALMAFYLFLSRGVKSYGRKFLLAGMIVLVLSTTWNYLSDAAINLTIVAYELVRSDEAVDGIFTVVAKALDPWQTRQVWPKTVQLMINDSLVVWRACSFWPHSKTIWYMLIGLMALNLVINIASDLYGLKEEIALFIEIVAIFASLFVNMIATSFVAIKVWALYRETKTIYPHQKGNSSPVQRTLLLLLESGTLFCFCQMFLCIFDAIITYATRSPSAERAFDIFDTLLMSVLPSFPLAVVVLISFLQWEDTYIVNLDTASS